MHLLVATAADCQKGYFPVLRRQLYDQDIDLLWKELAPFTWRKLIDWEHEVALSYPKATIVFCDTWDTLFQGTRNELEQLAGRYPLLLHSEKVCWPHSDKAALYPASPYPWRYVNGTGPAGLGSAIAEAIDFGKAHFPIVGDGTGVFDTSVDNDQRFWTDIYLAGLGRLDTRCELSQSLVEAKQGDFKIKDGKLYNNITGTKPLFIHANGAQSMIGFKSMMDHLAGVT